MRITISVIRRLLLTLICCCSVSMAFSQSYVFFLHNMFLEQYGPAGIHPQYGKAEYQSVIDAYRKEGLIVISELRAKNTDAHQYAQKVAGQVDSLIRAGVPPSHITVIGTSKGGYIARYTSALLKNTALSFVFIGCCGEVDTPDEYTHFYGNILSIYEHSDVVGRSCQQQKVRSGNDVKHFKEIELNTGLKHGFLFKALPEWIKPSAQWARQQYD